MIKAILTRDSCEGESWIRKSGRQRTSEIITETINHQLVVKKNPSVFSPYFVYRLHICSFAFVMTFFFNCKETFWTPYTSRSSLWQDQDLDFII